MHTGPEESLLLSRVLADLDAQRARASEQELCARMEPAHLAELRALQFRAAGPEPHFAGGDGRSKRCTLGADVVAMFEAGRAGGGGAATAEERERGGRGPPGPPWPETSESDFLLAVGGRAASLDKLHHLPRYSPSRQGPPPPPREPRPPCCLQKRNDFRKMAALRPQASAFDRRPGPAPFFTRSSEAAYGNPYWAPGLHERRRVKHESLDDLQAPAAAGPAAVRRAARHDGGRPARPVESLSLNVDDQRAGRLRSPKRAESVDGRDARASVGTQTESGGRKGPAGLGAAPSDRDSEPSADDISDMFRFLDEMSVCDSPGVVASSCYDSAGSLGSDSGESGAERGAVRPGRRQLDRLLRSLDGADGELKASVGQLLARMGRIESELESLSALRGEIAQVLGKLNKMDRKMRRPDTTDGGARQQDAPGSSSWQRSHGGRLAAWPPPAFCRHALTSADAERGPGPKKAAARSPKMDDADVGTRHAAPGHRRTSARSCRGKHAVRREETTGRDAGVQASGREHRYTFAPVARPPKAAATHAEERHLRAPPDAAGSPLYSLRHSCNAERDLHRAGDGATGVQAESVSADELAFWLEDVHTPGYDSLLRRREAEFRRAKRCKLAALIAATLGVILVIVVPICAMRP